MKRFLAVLLVLFLFSALPAFAVEELIYRTENVELHLPASWSERILILPTPTGATFYQKDSYDRYLEDGIPGGGYLFSLGASVNRSFEELEQYIYLGFSYKSAMHYYMQLPSDYPAFMDDEIRQEWDAMFASVRGIAQGAVIE